MEQLQREADQAASRLLEERPAGSSDLFGAIGEEPWVRVLERVSVCRAWSVQRYPHASGGRVASDFDAMLQRLDGLQSGWNTDAADPHADGRLHGGCVESDDPLHHDSDREAWRREFQTASLRWRVRDRGSRTDVSQDATGEATAGNMSRGTESSSRAQKVAGAVQGGGRGKWR